MVGRVERLIVLLCDVTAVLVVVDALLAVALREPPPQHMQVLDRDEVLADTLLACKLVGDRVRIPAQSVNTDQAT
jgi:hypothetical protein